MGRSCGASRSFRRDRRALRPRPRGAAIGPPSSTIEPTPPPASRSSPGASEQPAILMLSREPAGGPRLRDSRSAACGAPARRSRGRHDYHRPSSRVDNTVRVRRRPQPAVEDDPHERTAAVDASRRQQRIVGEYGSGADADRVHFGAFAVDAAVRRLTGEPRARPGRRRHATVKAERDLHGDERSALLA